MSTSKTIFYYILQLIAWGTVFLYGFTVLVTAWGTIASSKPLPASFAIQLILFSIIRIIAAFGIIRRSRWGWWLFLAIYIWDTVNGFTTIFSHQNNINIAIQLFSPLFVIFLLYYNRNFFLSKK